MQCNFLRVLHRNNQRESNISLSAAGFTLADRRSLCDAAVKLYVIFCPDFDALLQFIRCYWQSDCYYLIMFNIFTEILHFYVYFFKESGRLSFHETLKVAKLSCWSQKMRNILRPMKKHFPTCAIYRNLTGFYCRILMLKLMIPLEPQKRNLHSINTTSRCVIKKKIQNPPISLHPIGQL